MTDVDLCVNCYERTYRGVLTAGFFPTFASEHGGQFSRRTVIVNNVDDRREVETRVRELVDAGELDACFFVEDHIEHALQVTGLKLADIARAPYFTDWGIVLVTVPGPDWLVHCDPEVRMKEPRHWVAPSIELMEDDPRLMIANPRWYAPTPRFGSCRR